MNFTVIASKSENFINVYGMEMSEVVDETQVDCMTMTQAERKAKELYDTGKYDSIYISANQSEGSAWYNYHGGVGATGKNWVEHFEAMK